MERQRGHVASVFTLRCLELEMERDECERSVRVFFFLFPHVCFAHEKTCAGMEEKHTLTYYLKFQNVTERSERLCA